MPKPADIMDPSLYDSVRRPLLEATCLPPWCYTSQEFFDREVERIFLKTWNFLGREDEIPEPGDYLVVDMFGESLLALRGEDGRVRAFANVCRHRGTRLLSGKGHCRAVICPYHGWTYSREGRLIGARGMERAVGFDKGENGLIPIRLEAWAGFMFVNLSDSGPALTEHLGNMPEKFACYRFEDMVCVRRKEYDLACNWKIYIENAMEDYHTATVHRTSIGLQETIREDAQGEWDAIHMAQDRTIAVLPTDDPPFPHIEGLTGPAAVGSYFVILYPSTFFATTKDCMWWLQQLPQGPKRTRVVIGSCFPRSTVERPDFKVGLDKYYRRWDKALPEDNAISEQQQKGLICSLNRPGRLSHHEPIVHTIANWVLDRVLDGGGQS
jgi:choline monooxygenase